MAIHTISFAEANRIAATVEFIFYGACAVFSARVTRPQSGSAGVSAMMFCVQLVLGLLISRRRPMKKNNHDTVVMSCLFLAVSTSVSLAHKTLG
jgi:uncharacterized membrane protein YdcZ (DUF606 family)